MADLRNQTLTDRFQSLLTTSETTSNPTTGTLQNGKGSGITQLTVGGDIVIADKIIHQSDTNTAIRFPANDTVTVETAGVERLRVTSDGKVGIGTDVPLNYAGTNGLEISGGDPIIRLNDSDGVVDKSNYEIRGIGASGSEGLQFRTANTANTVFNSLMFLKQNGNVGIGTTSPTGKLHVAGGDIMLGASYALKFSSTAFITPENNVSGAEISTGGVLVVKTGVTPIERIRVTNDGLTFNGDTASANALDDYEEGTWTPAQGSGLAVVGAFSSSGSYTKIGRMVTVRGVVSGATSVAISTNAEISTNLPFVASTIFTGTIMNDFASASGGIYAAGALVISTTTFTATPALYFSATYFV